MHRQSATSVVATVVFFGLVAAAYTAARTPSTADNSTPTASPPVSASPTPSASTPTPTPYAGPKSTITVRFVSDGQPVTIVFGPPSAIYADGVRCHIIFVAVAVSESQSQFVIEWPLDTSSVQPIECSKGPPTTLRFEFPGGESGLLSTQFVWTGSDVTTDIAVPPGLVPTATPAVKALPSMGGPPGGGDQQADAESLVLLSLAALLFLVGFRALVKPRG